MTNPNLIPPDQQTPQQKNSAKSLLTLVNDARHAKWDESCRVYKLCEDNEDPSFSLVAGMVADPAIGLQFIHEQGFRVEAEAHGLCVVFDAVRALTYQEMVQNHPEAPERYREAIRNDFRMDDDSLVSIPDSAVEAYYNEQVRPLLPDATELPDDLCKRDKIGLLVLRDGTVTASLAPPNCTELEASVYTSAELKPGYSALLYTALHGLRPDGDCAEPLRAVEDHRILQELDF